MGTRAHIVITADPSLETALLALAESELTLMERRWSRFLPTSELCRLNAAAGKPVIVSADTFSVITSAVEAWQHTNGCFDPTVHDALCALGYDRSFGELPEENERAGTSAPTPGCAGIELDPALHAVRLPVGVHLDLGGIGKGAAADLVVSRLLAAGADGACVNLGGDIRVEGRAPTTAGWIIELAFGNEARRRVALRGWRGVHVDENQASMAHGRRRKAPHHRSAPRHIDHGCALGQRHRRPRDTSRGADQDDLRRRCGRRPTHHRGQRLLRRDRRRQRSGFGDRLPRGDCSMNGQLWWYVARSGGFLAWALSAFSILWGLLITSRALGKRISGPRLLDLHRFIGGLSVVFVFVHIFGLWLHSYKNISFGLNELLVPMASKYHPGAVAYGIVGFYLLIAVEITSLLRRRIPASVWRSVHYGGFVVFLLGSIHALKVGTDVQNPVIWWPSAVLCAAIVGLAVTRAMSAAQEAPTRSPGARDRDLRHGRSVGEDHRYRPAPPPRRPPARDPEPRPRRRSLGHDGARRRQSRCVARTHSPEPRTARHHGVPPGRAPA